MYTGLGTGESYYFRGAYNLALSYFDQPPLFFWLSHLSLKLFGINTFAIRLPALLFSALNSWLLFLIARHFFSEKAALYTIVIFNLSALYIINGIWFQPDAALLFFWAASLYVLVQIFFPHQLYSRSQLFGLWILLGICMGLTGLSKYHVVFFFLGMGLFILTRQRKWLTYTGLYSSFIVCLIFFLPILIWNYQHDWVSIKFQSSRALAEAKIVWHIDWFLRSFIGQALWLLPWIWVPVVYELVRAYKIGVGNDSKLVRKFSAKVIFNPKLRDCGSYSTSDIYWFFFCMALFPIVFFTAATLWADLSYHFHWQSVGYMILFIPLGATIERKIQSGSGSMIKKWLWFSAIFAYGVLVIAALQVEAGFWQNYGPRALNREVNSASGVNNLIDPTMDSYDYTDLYAYFEKNQLFDQENLFVGVSNWLLSGKVDWALKGKIEVRSFEEMRNYAYYFDDKEHLGQNLIFITRDDWAKALSDTENNCSDLKKLADVPITRNGRTELVLHLYTCNNFHI